MIAESGRNEYEYTFGYGYPRPLHKYLQIINKTVAPYMEFVYGAMSAGIALSAQDYDTSETTADTGFVPEVDFESGIRITYDWIKKNEAESCTKP